MNVTETIVILILFSFRWFPLLQALLQRVSYNRFVELEKEVLLPMAIFCWEPVLVNFVDSTPLHVCRNQRILIHKIFEGLAEHGKCSMKCFFGFKLHVIINDKGKILNFMFTLWSMDDCEPLKLLILYRTHVKLSSDLNFSLKNRHKAQRKAKFYINKCRSASCMQSGLKQASA